MTDSIHNDGAGGLIWWVVAAVAAFAIVGTIDWGRAVWASTDAGIGGTAAAWLVFVSLWGLGGAGWGLITAVGVWVATGRTTATPLLQRAAAVARRWWRQRHDVSDARRVANFVAAVGGMVTFATGSVAWTTYLIETANLSWLIAVTSLGGQVVLALITWMAGAGFARLLHAGLIRLRRAGGRQWLNFPVILVVTVGICVPGAVAALVVGRDAYLAVEGPALTLLAVAIVVHPLLASVASRPLKSRRAIALGLVVAVLVATLGIGVGGQHADARRILVLHADGAHFAFNQLHRHVDIDRVFDRSECPLPNPDGSFPDGMATDEYEQLCLDPDYHRPVSRDEIPDYRPPEHDRRPSFVLVTWDSVRVDRLGFMGHHRESTPNLDEFAEDGMVFERAFTQDSGTGPSFWSMVAGKTPFQVSLLHARQFPPPIAPDEQLLGEMLEQAGYQNVGVMCGTLFDREVWGIERGFDRFENVCGSERRFVAPTVTEQGVKALEELVESDEPFFLWVHYFDPHYPYNNHPEIGYGDGRLDRYDEELTYTDDHFGRFVAALEKHQSDYSRPLYTMFGADHGENFGEHGTDPHARNLYRVVTHVPKIVAGPGIESGRIDAPVAFNDIYPTVLELAGVEIPEKTTMVSQVPVLFGAEADDHRMVFQENSYSRPRRHTRGVVYDRYHYIADLTTNTEELFDYVDDPLERTNLIGAGLPEEQVLRQAVIRFLETTEIPEGLED